MRRLVLLALFATASLPITAQQAQPLTGATVSGSIFCADTGRPARFARIVLKSAAVQSPTARNNSSGNTPLATANVEGAYSIAGVAPGAYYVQVMMPGYLDPASLFTDQELHSTDADIRERVAAKVPMLTILGTESTRLNLTIDRAAAVSGRLLYDDGSSAAGWVVSLHRPGVALGSDATINTRTLGITDDRGDFRVANVPPGSYILRAETNTLFGGAETHGMAMSIYNGSVFRAADAKPFTVTAGQELPGININVPLRSLHSISGTVTARSDSHAINSGSVTLTSPDDPSFNFSASISNGTFAFYYLPGNTTYRIEVNGYDSTPASPANTPVRTVNGMQVRAAFNRHNYSPVATTVTLGDMDIGNISIALPEATAQPDSAAPFKLIQ